MAVFKGSILLLFISSTAGSYLFDFKRAADQRSPCVEAYNAVVDFKETWKELKNEENSGIFEALGFSLDRKQELKEFICKIPGISSVRQLARLTPLRNYSQVANIYAVYTDSPWPIKDLAKLKMIEFRINKLGQELGISSPKNFPQDINHLISLYGNRETMLTFFSTLECEFGPSFTFYLDGVRSIWLTDVPAMVDILQANVDKWDRAAYALGIPKMQLLHFLTSISYYIAEPQKKYAELRRRNAVYLNKLDAIGFWSLSDTDSVTEDQELL